MLCDGRIKELNAKFAKRTAKDAKKDLLHVFLCGIFAHFAVMIFLPLQIIPAPSRRIIFARTQEDNQAQ
jgi:hypothetical protein